MICCVFSCGCTTNSFNNADKSANHDEADQEFIQLTDVYKSSWESEYTRILNEIQNYDLPTAQKTAQFYRDSTSGAENYMNSFDISDDLKPARNHYLNAAKDMHEVFGWLDLAIDGIYDQNTRKTLESLDYAKQNYYKAASEVHSGDLIILDYQAKHPSNTNSTLSTISPTGTVIVSSTTEQSVTSKYQNLLPLNTIYRQEKSGTPDTLSLKVTRASLWDSYSIENTKQERVTAKSGEKFLIAFLEVTYSGNNKMYSPPLYEIKLKTNNATYIPERINNPVQGAGTYYTSHSLNRDEKDGGCLIYKVPDYVTLDTAIIEIELGSGSDDNPRWLLN